VKQVFTTKEDEISIRIKNPFCVRVSFMTKPLPSLIAKNDSLTVDGHHRTFLSVAPLDLPTGAPLIVVFHGSYQSGQGVRDFSGGAFDELAAREKLMVVYPDAYKKLWNDARIESNYPARLEGYDDVAFFLALVAHFTQTAGIDASRVYVAGYSNGAQFVNRLVHEVSDVLAGAALIAATQPAPENFPAGMPSNSLPVVLIHGTGDRLVPYEGGMASFWGFRPRGLGLSHLATAEYLAARNGITTTPVVRKLPAARSAKTSLTVRDWTSPDRPSVRAITVEGGGHVIPNQRKSAAIIYGRTNMDLDSAAAIWDFFTQEGASGTRGLGHGSQAKTEPLTDGLKG
jgi:polyhydroxybutyrate depolymerase